MGTEIKQNQWWRRKRSGLPYCVGVVALGTVFLLNEIGVPEGKWSQKDFVENFYPIQ